MGNSEQKYLLQFDALWPSFLNSLYHNAPLLRETLLPVFESVTKNWINWPRPLQRSKDRKAETRY